MSKRGKSFRLVAALTAALMVGSPTGAVADPPLGGAAASTLGQQPLLTPADLGKGNVDGLQFGNPTDHLALVDPPDVSNDGGAHLSYPLVIPPGRGITPELSIDYDSGGDDAWVGQGWDISAGDISVDTRWGAPRFDSELESETYDIDGQMLVPNALGSTWQPRVSGDRADYSRQVETDYAQIIRHEAEGTGGGPKNYYWEVHDKGGNVFWYGGTPDDGGPVGTPGTSHIDRSAIVTDEDGNQVQWLLSAQRDVGVNRIGYRYQTVHYTYGDAGWTVTNSCTPSGDTLCAKHTYLSDIYYTGAAAKAGWKGHLKPFDPPYDVQFIRQSTLDPTHPRQDPSIDASGRYVDLMKDRLARVQVMHGSAAATGQDVRDYDQLAVRYDLDYATGAFGKSLLSSVTQVGSDGTTKATHTFDYVNRVGTQASGYDGFAAPKDWNTGDDEEDTSLLSSSASISALGASESNSAEGHAYIGFNPAVPDKVGSYGGSLQVSGGDSKSLSEWLDINGDGLPDKVYRDGGSIKYRLNQSRPGSATTDFSDPATAQGISKLSHDANIGLEAALEAYPGVSIAFGLGTEISWGDAYFSDVNADGLPDYVSGGAVYFDHLEGGVPHFVEGDSASTPVPIQDGTATVDLPDDVKQAQQDLAAQNPLIDTVRRWVAPFAGTVTVDAPVTFTPPPGVVSKDGVRVAIQHNSDDELAAGNLINAGSQAFTDPIKSVSVHAGDHIYFRVGSVSDGSNDDVSWAPTITYTAIDGVDDLSKLPTDVNGLSQVTYDENADYTLSGRPETNVLMPFAGTVHFSATVTKSVATTDGLRVVLKHNGQVVSVADATFASDFTGSRDVAADFDVAAPVVPTDKTQDGKEDSVTATLMANTPIDLHAAAWDPKIAYTAATDRDGKAIDLAKRPLSFDMTPEVSNYPQITPAPQVPFHTLGHVATAKLDFQVGANQAQDHSAVVTVKNRNGVVAEDTVTLPQAAGPFTATASLNADLADGNYWLDVTIPDPRLARETRLVHATLYPDAAAPGGLLVPATLYGAGTQGIFPVPYRGWGSAGYNGDGSRATAKIDEDDFVLDSDALKSKYGEPSGFDQLHDSPPKPDNAYAYLPHVTFPNLAADVPGAPSVPDALWIGSRPELHASAADLSSSRLSVDSPAPGAVPNGSGRAVTRLAITGPEAKLAFGLGPLSASFGVGPSFGLVDYEDMNGDGYPDVITPNHITYTQPRGGYEDSKSGGPAHVSQDLTFSLGLGLESGLVDITSNSKGHTNSNQGGSSQKGGDADSDGGGVGVGADLNISWTNPNNSDPNDSPSAGTKQDTSDPSSKYGKQIGDVPSSSSSGSGEESGAIQLGLADVNGDGLPDRVFATPAGTFARYNLGYGFTSASVKLSGGGFDTRESYEGGISFGFSTPWADFSGGAALNWDVDLSRYAWVDVNGDGILDQLHKINDTDPPTVRFGTGTGTMSDPVPYGPTATDKFTNEIGAGQQIAFDRASGAGAQFDFTIAIGPLCEVACYLIVNPGASYQHGVSSSEVDLQDVNGDGYADSVKSTNDDTLTVRENRQADTNLLSAVHNPLGGTIDLTYKRDGNTVDNPGSTWDMSTVTVHDGRPGDGVDVTRKGYAYSGLRYDRLQRSGLGYSAATETEFAKDGTTPLRRTEHTYLNDNVFDAGLETNTLVKDPDGNYISGKRQTWQLHDISPSVDNLDLNSVAALTYSVGPLMTKAVQEVGLGDGMGVGESTTTTYSYDDLGDVVRQIDLGEDDDPNDDVEADMVYTRCATSSELTDDGPCTGDHPHGATSTFYDGGLCATWVSLPGEITVTNGKSGADRVVYRHRDGRPALCDNASVTHLEESINGSGDVAVTDLAYDSWGSYNRIVYPLGENGKRYAVCYTYDDDQHGQVAKVTEYDLAPNVVDEFLNSDNPYCATAEETTRFPGGLPEGLHSSATFDPLSGGIASRTDANGNVVRYTYDPLGRIATVSSAVPSDKQPLVAYDYSIAPGNTHVIAHHYDAFHPDDTIDTATFVDGLGRVVQTKRDAAVYQGPGQSASVGIVASGLTMYDDLQHSISTYNPRVSTVPIGQFDDTQPTADDRHTDSEWDLWDEVVKQTEPGNRVTTSDFEYGSIKPGGPQLFQTTVTLPNGRSTIDYTDVRDVLRASDDVPVGAPAKRTLFGVDGMGQVLKTTDPDGYVTTNQYDLLGRRTSTTTPDAGRVDMAYDADSQLTSKTTPNLRAKSQKINYHYDLAHLVAVDYPGSLDDVSYQYGGMNAPENGAGQVVKQEDGSRIVTSGYDAAGDVTRQTATIKLHNWTPTADQSQFTWTTRWTYDGLGRLNTVRYPDAAKLAVDPAYNGGVGSVNDPGELLSYDYDAGGQVKSAVGSEQGVRKEQVGTNPVDGTPVLATVPHTWNYTYLADRQYDVFLHRRSDTLGNDDNTVFSYDADTQWLVGQRTVAPRRNLGGQSTAYREVQDLSYTYDPVGNPLTYANDLPPATSSLFGGPSSQKYSYDPYDRLVGATGQWDAGTGKTRKYSLNLTYDGAGNLTKKDQRDVVNNGTKDLVQDTTTYSLSSTFTNAAPHQPTKTGTNSMVYDADGNLTNIKDPKNKDVRVMTWDGADRMRMITDGPQTTTYNYDDQGNRTIERGPSGETATLNPWVTITNGAPLWKHIWAGDDRISTQRDDGGNNELDKQYFLHKDLQGSTNIVTDANGDVFQHHEYFAGGEQWVTEDSTVFRTPFQYAGGYLDEQRSVINFEARWYDQKRNVFYSPEPLLTEDADALEAEPGLRDAYSYALSNPVGFVDPTGYRPLRPGYSRELDAAIEKMRNDWSKGFGPDDKKGARLAKQLKHQKRFNKIDEFFDQPLIEVNISTGEVKIGFGLVTFGKAKERKAKAAANASPSSNNAASSSGGPAVSSGAGVPADSGKAVAPAKHTPPKKPLPAVPAGKAGPVGSE